MKAFVIAVASLALLISPAAAQRGGKGKRAANGQQAAQHGKKNAAAEKAYRDALRRIPDQKVVNDPWASMRK